MKKISRNDSCWCGSGKKYKQCHETSDTRLKKLKNDGYQIPTRGMIRAPKEVEGIRRSAKITHEILDLLEEKVVAGITTKEIDDIVYDYALLHGAIPATIGFQGYKHSCCTSINNVICHGVPDDTVLKEGDIINVDTTINLDGYFSDASRMYLIGEVSEEAKAIVACAKKSLELAIEKVKPFESVSIIGRTIEPYANGLGYTVVRDLTGHGIGLELHCDPQIIHYEDRDKGMIMVPGMVFTIEPMINEKSYRTKQLSDGWTITTIDGGLSAQWEHTILVTEDGAEILT
ncbi:MULTISPECIES: type I methionyl aminopeptidase [unclassified Fusibacter]|uniref:type I methionyl aminopeptidase n=1 Tax=unclassified Fusibacter TaxID=2624464 RepID=UPI0010114CFC|nr:MULTISPECIES: type I methionyl aminopeptidase [unclassified Fusibacter]MCK8060189.1 type I methionyl aminopeptidase [Fusibacter sp. A2]NPE22329.1 type I methionyl aminopeptidase [Fusibacter sp. A1]RXV61102.1 type I methionyl aminopeptidase [Fusibacter sp. A1]